MREVLSYDVAVNGEPMAVRADAEATLLEVLRTELNLTGAKRGCNQGVCGACTVLLDGRPVRSCLTLAANVGERAVTTVEGLSPAGSLSPVQQAFLESGAVQCGFCTPGMVIAVEALLRDKPKPSADEVREALSGNLCRCSGYVKIVEAAMRAAGAAP
jgi:aerobic-type carbon monoxide dehydrogenase small subunit (CoxS/CutS family)